MGKKEQQAERELLELIARSRAVRLALTRLTKRLGKAELYALGLGNMNLDLVALVELEEAAHRGLDKLKKPKGEP
jgi:hypothetical protein